MEGKHTCVSVLAYQRFHSLKKIQSFAHRVSDTAVVTNQIHFFPFLQSYKIFTIVMQLNVTDIETHIEKCGQCGQKCGQMWPIMAIN